MTRLATAIVFAVGWVGTSLCLNYVMGYRIAFDSMAVNIIVGMFFAVVFANIWSRLT